MATEVVRRTQKIRLLGEIRIAFFAIMFADSQKTPRNSKSHDGRGTVRVDSSKKVRFWRYSHTNDLHVDSGFVLHLPPMF